ncbi:MAG: hypothetical protein Q7P63_06305 [Verrucomicrobiota bacterium JB022]|nr:hypothetical protein [Verrucomicrobiota bacterium JB022]
MKILTLITLFFGGFFLAACGDNAGGSVELSDTDVVPSGTYTGVAKEVDPEEQEIYVETADGKTIELYFTERTQLMRNNQVVQFQALQQGQRVEVEVEKVGQRLEPIKVTILAAN